MKRLRYIFLSLFALSLLNPVASYAAEVTAGADFASAYVWRGVVFNDEAVFQPSIDIGHESGVSFNVWGNMDLGDFNDTLEEGEFSEVDLTLAYATPIEFVDFSFGVIHYLFPEAGSDAATTEIFFSLAKELFPEDFPGFSVSGDLYIDIDEVNDVYGAVGISQDLNVLLQAEDFPIAMELAASFGFAGDEFAAAYGGIDSGAFDWNTGISGSYAITETLELSMFFNVFGSLDNDVLPDQTIDVYGGGGLYYSF